MKKQFSIFLLCSSFVLLGSCVNHKGYKLVDVELNLFIMDKIKNRLNKIDYIQNLSINNLIMEVHFEIDWKLSSFLVSREPGSFGCSDSIVGHNLFILFNDGHQIDLDSLVELIEYKSENTKFFNAIGTGMGSTVDSLCYNSVTSYYSDIVFKKKKLFLDDFISIYNRFNNKHAVYNTCLTRPWLFRIVDQESVKYINKPIDSIIFTLWLSSGRKIEKKITKN